MDAGLVQELRDITYAQMTIVQAQIEMNAMVAANQACVMKGIALSFSYGDFMALVEKHGVHHNAILTNMRRY